MHVPHLHPSSHVVFYKQSFFDLVLVKQRKKLCALPLLSMNPGFGDSKCQIIVTKRERVHSKSKNTFRTKTKTSNKQPAASHKDTDGHSAVCSLHLCGSCCCVKTSKVHVVALWFDKMDFRLRGMQKHPRSVKESPSLRLDVKRARTVE